MPNRVFRLRFFGPLVRGLMLSAVLILAAGFGLGGGNEAVALSFSNAAEFNAAAFAARPGMLADADPLPPAAVADNLETTLNQFLQSIPRGYYGLRDINTLKTRLKETDLVLIDVRETAEYATGHINGAINIPLRTLVENLPQVPKDKPVMLYCSSGYRTGMGVMALRLLGYDNVEGFPPSYQGWQKVAG
jgi:rhodanese-related sulfurtransferase